MQEIPVHARGAVVATALVDDELYDLLACYSWQLMTVGLYAYRRRPAVEQQRNGWGKTAVMQREVLGLPSAGWPLRANTLVVDHRNGNRLDNRRENLEVITHSENIRRGQVRRWARERESRPGRPAEQLGSADRPGQGSA